MEARGTRAVTLGPRSKGHRARFPRIPNYYVTVDSMFLRLGARCRVYFTYIINKKGAESGGANRRCDQRGRLSHVAVAGWANRRWN